MHGLYNKKNKLNLFSIFITILIVILVFSSISGAQQVNYGDLNDDGKVDVQDVVLVTQYVLELTVLDEAQKSAADVNEDGVVNVKDVTLIIQYVLGIIDSLPVEVAEENGEDNSNGSENGEPANGDNGQDNGNCTVEGAAGTWSVIQSFDGAITSDFTVNLENIDQASHFELYVDGVIIGSRVAIDDYVRSVTLVFSNPELMQVKIYSSSTATNPLAEAACLSTGELKFK